jgi:DSF synthase
MKRAEEMIFSGRIYTAAELHEMGVVDVVVEDGTGEAAVYDYVNRNKRRRNGMQAMFNCRRHLNPISYDELLNITNIWVDAALRLEDKDLKLMSRLGRSQLKRLQGDAPAQAREATEMPEEMQYAQIRQATEMPGEMQYATA